MIRVFVGGATQPDLFNLDDDELKTLVRGELASLLGASGEPILIEVARHARAMPQYTLGHADRIAEIQLRAAQHPRLILAGNAFNGVGIPDCVRSGQDAATALLTSLGRSRGAGRRLTGLSGAPARSAQGGNPSCPLDLNPTPAK